jgi:hypothetical protein
MALLDSPDMYGHTLFCDDIRAEVDGKMMFIGSYGTQMLVHSEFPVTLPKFAFGITFNQKKTLFDPNLGIRIFLPQDSDDAPSIRADMFEEKPIVANIPFATPIAEQDEKHAIVTLTANLIFAPFTIVMPGLIKVRIARRGDQVRVGVLSVAKAPQATTSAAH